MPLRSDLDDLAWAEYQKILLKSFDRTIEERFYLTLLFQVIQPFHTTIQSLESIILSDKKTYRVPTYFKFWKRRRFEEIFFTFGGEFSWKVRRFIEKRRRFWKSFYIILHTTLVNLTKLQCTGVPSKIDKKYAWKHAYFS